MRWPLLILALMLSYGASAQATYPTFGQLKAEMDANRPGVAMGYVMGVLHGFRQSSELSKRTGGKILACIDQHTFITPREVGVSLIESLSSNTVSASVEIHPELIQLTVISILVQRGACAS